MNAAPFPGAAEIAISIRIRAATSAATSSSSSTHHIFATLAGLLTKRISLSYLTPAFCLLGVNVLLSLVGHFRYCNKCAQRDEWLPSGRERRRLEALLASLSISDRPSSNRLTRALASNVKGFLRAFAKCHLTIGNTPNAPISVRFVFRAHFYIGL